MDAIDHKASRAMRGADVRQLVDCTGDRNLALLNSKMRLSKELSDVSAPVLSAK
jgi:hypothetical protein